MIIFDVIFVDFLFLSGDIGAQRSDNFFFLFCYRLPIGMRGRYGTCLASTSPITLISGEFSPTTGEFGFEFRKESRT